MAFTIPDSATAWNPIQARIQTGDLQILTDAIDQVGVVTGCAVTPQGSPNMTVAVASGSIHVSSGAAAVSAGNVTITANSSGNPRLDLICVDSSGVKSAVAGTGAASPKYPAIPGGSVVLAAVLVPTGATEITANNIVDKRAFVITTASGALQAANNLSDVANAASSRTNLALGTMATQAASGVTITGGTVTGITDLTVADGGTGASTAAGARSNLDAAQTAHSHAASDLTSGTVATARLGGGTASSSNFLRGDQTWAIPAGGGGGGTLDTEIMVAIGDETTTITSTGNPKLTMRMPHGMTLSEVRGSLTTASTSGAVTFDVAVEGDSIFSTALTIDQDETTSTTATTAAVLGTEDLWDDAEMTFSISGAGTGAKGPKVTLIGERADIAPPGSGIAFVAASNTTYASRTTTTVTKPSGTADGDYVVLGILTGAVEAPDPTPPGGFTLIAGPIDATDGSFNVEMRVYGKIASSEGASWDFTHTSCSSQGFALTYSGVHATTQVDVTSSGATGAGATSTAPQVTTVTNNAMLVFVEHDWGSNSANLTAPTGFTERIEVNPLLYVAEKVMVTAGATGSVVFTNNNTPASSDTWGAVLIALRPA